MCSATWRPPSSDFQAQNTGSHCDLYGILLLHVAPALGLALDAFLRNAGAWRGHDPLMVISGSKWEPVKLWSCTIQTVAQTLMEVPSHLKRTGCGWRSYSFQILRESVHWYGAFKGFSLWFQRMSLFRELWRCGYWIDLRSEIMI